MYKRLKKLIDIYMIMVVLGILLWIPFPELGHVIGATSIIQSFLLVVGDTTKWVKYLSLIWLLIFSLSLTGSYIVVCVKKKYKAIILIMGIELLIAGIIVFYMICSGSYYNMITLIMGYLIRLMYFVLVFFNYTSKGKQVK